MVYLKHKVYFTFLDGFTTKRTFHDSQRLEEKFTSSTFKWRKVGHPPADNCHSHPPDAFKLLPISPSSDCLAHLDICFTSPHLLSRAFPVCPPFPNQHLLPCFSVCLSKWLCCFMLYIQTCYLFQCQLSLPGPVNLSCLFLFFFNIK